MTHDKFMTSLMQFYREKPTDGIDNYGNKIINLRVEENDRWLRNNVPGQHLADLWAAVIMQFKQTTIVPFPLVGDLQEIYNRTRVKETPSGFRQAALDRGETMPPGDIATTVNRLRLKDNPSMAEIDFIDAWEILAYNWGRIKDETGDEYRAHQYCDEVKRSILRGDEIKHTDGAYERVAEIFGKEDSRK